MNRDLADFLATCQRRVDAALSSDSMLAPSGTPSALREATSYSLAGAGKRIRPVLCWATAQAIGETDPARASAPALALELIHTYSLIHDDLPSMDDDDMRRGKPSLHRAFNEATAVLVGDAMQARAFGLIAEAPSLDTTQKVAMVTVLARAAGPSGMVGGQFIDVAATDSDMDLQALRHMHELKTAALIRAAVALGGIAANASTAQLEALERYAAAIGLAFQVVDDILDVEGDTATLGKTGGKDFAANKPTYVSLLGLEGARAQARELLESALQALDVFGESADLLRALARYIVERDR